MWAWDWNTHNTCTYTLDEELKYMTAKDAETKPELTEALLPERLRLSAQVKQSFCHRRQTA